MNASGHPRAEEPVVLEVAGFAVCETEGVAMRRNLPIPAIQSPIAGVAGVTSRGE